MEKKELTCIGCPMGCALSVELEGEKILSISGNTCAIGESYAKTEVVNPLRTVTTTAKISGAHISRIPVKTATAISKRLMFDCVNEINRLDLRAPVHRGDVVLKNVCASGVDVIATRTII